MSVCAACGGVIGRDCFNPTECMAITRDMAQRFQEQEQTQPGEADAIIATLTGQVAALREALTRIDRDAEAFRLMLVQDEAKGRSISQGSHDRWQGMHRMAEIARAALSQPSAGEGKA